MSKINAVHQRDITLEMVAEWIARGHIRGVRLPEGYGKRPESEIMALLTGMFELPAQLDEH